MKLVIAEMLHETNTFSPVPTDWARFDGWGAHFGVDVERAFGEAAVPVAAYIRLAREAGAEYVTPMAAEAMPSGPVAAKAYERMCAPILEAVAAGCDAALLHLHGAMVTATTDDGEGTLLACIRAIAPELPIGVTCDLHCNLTATMVENCTALIGYKTYPHVDSYDVALQIGRVLLRGLAGEVRPVMAWDRRPLLAQTLRMGTDDSPMRELIAMTRQVEADGALAATVFGGFPLADIADAGLSAVTVTDGDADAARAANAWLLDAAWAQRAEFVYRGEPLDEALERASGLKEGPILLLDHADNCGSGGTQDVMTVIAAVIAKGLKDVAVAAVWDPEAVSAMTAAGVGADVTLDLGGKTAMPSIGRQGNPLAVSGRVSALSAGEWVVGGPMFTGTRVSTGPTAVLDTGAMEIVVVSRHHEPWDLGIFESVGIEPASKRYLVLKSRIHYRAAFAAIARHTITCDGDGVTTSENARLHFERVRRPIYPLDEVSLDG